MQTAIIVTFIDDNGFPVRKVFVDEAQEMRRTYETKIPLNENRGHYTIQVEIIPSIHTV